MTLIERIVERTRATYEAQAPKGKTDAWGGAESTRVTAAMLLDLDADSYTDEEFTQAVLNEANGIEP